MANTRTLIWYFYRPVFLWNNAFSLTFAVLFMLHGYNTLPFGLFFKFLGYGSTVFLQSATAKNVYMYYRNAGHSIRRMYAYVFGIDFLIYIVLLFVSMLIRNELLKG